ncbi:hypothetical protein NDU88_010911 [Pleurodeles waltl]|uniref:Uncharacterized protein n=1 Tax=Pleurodeles waltl TaxID=8319 RepID=A0AAV7QVQ7_PLEWA|nr:hypothetical protein NDU88_010911 [Pleurodeles waltl]
MLTSTTEEEDKLPLANQAGVCCRRKRKKWRRFFPEDYGRNQYTDCLAIKTEDRSKVKKRILFLIGCFTDSQRRSSQ